MQSAVSVSPLATAAVGCIPGLGRLFRFDKYPEDRVELLVMAIPYVVADFKEDRELTERIKEELELHKQYEREAEEEK